MSVLSRVVSLGTSFTEYNTRPLVSGKWGLILKKPLFRTLVERPSKSLVFQEGPEP
jgi:hypothetical protein